MKQLVVAIIYLCLTVCNGADPVPDACPLVDVGEPCISTIAFGKNSELGHSKSSVLRANGLRLIITCVSSDPTRWAINVVPDLPVGKIETITSVSPESGQNIFVQKIATKEMVGVRGTVRCVSNLNESSYAEMFIEDNNDDAPRFLHPSEKLKLFVHEQSDDGFVVPCGSSGPENFTDPNGAAKLLKLERSSRFKFYGLDRPGDTYGLLGVDCLFSSTSKAKKNETLVSDSCLHCLCSIFNCAPTECRDGDEYCGIFRIGFPFWIDSRDQAKTAMNVDRDFRECANNYDCASAHVRRYMENTKTDCNGDGKLECADFIMTHRTGPLGCIQHAEDARRDLELFKACLPTVDSPLTVLAISDNVQYDRRVGFKVKKSPDYRSIYVCARETDQQLEAYLPLDPENQVPSLIQYGTTDSPVMMSGIICEVPDKNMKNLFLSLEPCSTMTECDLYFRPRVETLARLSRNLTLSNVEEAGQIKLPSVVGARRRVMRSLPGPDGIIACFANHFPEPSKEIKYVRNIDHYFTGLDTKIYILSKGFPDESVMSISAAGTNFGEGEDQIFTCRISKFVVVPSFEFHITFANGVTETVMGTADAQRNKRVDAELSGVFQEERIAFQRLTVKLDPAIRAISCRCPRVDSSSWVQQQMAVEVIKTGSSSHNFVTAAVKKGHKIDKDQG